MLKLQTDRPLAFFDIEATGTNPRTDRIIDLAVVKVMPKGTKETHEWRINPGMPIPAEASAIHGIHDADVKDCPSFKALAPKIDEALMDCDLAGYNILRFDIPMLAEEFLRSGVPFSTENRRVVDIQRIFHQREPRDLSAALKFYCGEMHLGAHGALEDVLATVRVLEGQIERYKDLPRDVSELHEYCNPRDPSWVDGTGKLKWANKEIVINFGRNQGRLLKDLVKNEPNFIQWMLKNDFPRDTQEILRDAMAGKYPPPAL